MIYLNNNTEIQTINIPYSQPDIPVTKEIQSQKNFTVTENGQYNIYPDSGFTAMAKVHLNVDTPNVQEAFESGQTYQKSLMVEATITENGVYSRPNGYSQVNIEVSGGSGEASFGVLADISNVGCILDLTKDNTTYVEIYFYAPGIKYSQWSPRDIISIYTGDANRGIIFKSGIIRRITINGGYSSDMTTNWEEDNMIGVKAATINASNQTSLSAFYPTEFDFARGQAYTGGDISGNNKTHIFASAELSDQQIFAVSEFPRYLHHMVIQKSGVRTVIYPRSDGKMWNVSTNQESDLIWYDNHYNQVTNFRTIYPREVTSQVWP